MNELSKHIGKRIRYYRKAKNLTISQLAELICKSKSSISKYENAEVAMDIETLYSIATALDITLAHLTDYAPPASILEPNHLDGFFHNANVFYMYNMYYSQTIFQSVLIIKTGTDTPTGADCYFDVKNLDDHYNCGCLYHGRLTASYTHVNFHLSNEINPADEMFLCFNNLFYSTGTTTGIACCISEHLITPCSVKTILSKTPIRSRDKLKELFQLTNNEQKYLRSSNMLIVERSNSTIE